MSPESEWVMNTLWYEQQQTGREKGELLEMKKLFLRKCKWLAKWLRRQDC